tara:strand:+ start:6397 stop:7023 length:627 start_codon:yes stop_codon:yes gene_type:complete
MEKEENIKSKQDDKHQQNDSDEVLKEKEVENKEAEISTEDKIKNLEDKLARTFAEMENQRRRFEKEKSEAFEYGGFAFAREALNLIDNLERSKISLENDESLKDNDALKKITEHLEIIYKDMISILKKNNIEEIKSINQKLDPNLHQAMIEIEDDSKEAGTILQVIQKGFTMKDRLLRPSLVGVSKKKVKEDTKDKKNQENQEKTKEK